MRYGNLQKRFNPVGFAYHHSSRIGIVPHTHAQEVFDAQFGQAFADVYRQIIWKKGSDLVLNAQFLFSYRKTHCGGGKTFADRIHGVLQVIAVGIPPAFRDDLAVPQHHNAVKLVLTVGGSFQKVENPL